MPKPQPQFIHEQYWAEGCFGPRIVSAKEARTAWKLASHVDGTAEFGFRTLVVTEAGRFELGTTYTPITGYPLPAHLADAVAQATTEDTHA